MMLKEKTILRFLLCYCLSYASPLLASVEKTNDFQQLDTTAIQLYLKQGVDLLHKNKYDSAAIILKKALSNFPPTWIAQPDTSDIVLFVQVNNYIGYTYYCMGKLEESLNIITSTREKWEPVLGKQHKEIAINNWYNGKIMVANRAFEEAEHFFASALSILNKKDAANIATILSLQKDLGSLAYKQYDYDKAEKYFQLSLKTASQKLKADDNVLASIYNGLGNLRVDRFQFEEALIFFNKALSIKQKKYGNLHGDVGATYYNIARIYRKTGNWDSVAIYTQKTLEIDQHIYGINHNYVAEDLNQLGKAYRMVGEVSKALEYFQQAKSIQEKLYNGPHQSLADSYTDLGLVHLNQANYQAALENFKHSLDVYLVTIGSNHYNTGICYHNIGSTYSRLGNFEMAQSSFEKALAILRSDTKEHFPTELASLYRGIAETQFLQGATEKGKQSIYQAINIYQTFIGNKHPEIAVNYNQLGKQAIKKDSLQTALHYFQSAINALLPHTSEANPFKDIPHESISNDKKELIQTLVNKAELLERIAQQNTNKNKALLAAHQHYTHAIHRTPQLLQDFKRNEDKERWLQQIQSAYEGGIRTAFSLYEKNRNKSFLPQSFAFSEQYKGTLLLQSIRNAGAVNFANIPEEYLDKEHQLKHQLSYYEKILFEEQLQQERDIDSTNIDKLQQQLFVVQHSYDSLILHLEQEYPEYYQLKYNREVVSLEEIQHMLKSNQALLEYFVGDSSIFAFLVTSNDYQVKQIKLDFPLSEWVQSLRTGLYDYWLIPNSSRNKQQYTHYNKQYTDASYFLYQKLIAPLDNLPEKLIIIPDGILGYLPFETLLRKKAEDPSAFKSHAYLGKQHQVSYNYSATLWKEMRDKQYDSKGLLAYAPSFGTEKPPLASVEEYRRDNLSNLLFNVPEANDIADIFSGLAITGTAATREHFLEQAQNYSIIHLATHAKLDDQHNDYSFLAFSGATDSLNDSKVYIRDLYNLQLPAELVVLSACETGIGKLQKGEGIISLARGFTYAGAKSIVTSLWEVNDQSASEIMVDFYQSLKNGKDKNTSLQQAKLNYINNQVEDQMAHPFFWAAFVGVGDMRPLYFSSGVHWWRWGLTGFFLLLCSYYFYTKRN